MAKRNINISIRKRTPQQNTTLLRYLAIVDLTYIAAFEDLQEAWDISTSSLELR